MSRPVTTHSYVMCYVHTHNYVLQSAVHVCTQLGSKGTLWIVNTLYIPQGGQKFMKILIRHSKLYSFRISKLYSWCSSVMIIMWFKNSTTLWELEQVKLYFCCTKLVNSKPPTKTKEFNIKDLALWLMFILSLIK